MATYVLAYVGGSMPETQAERDASMAAWGAFLGGVGDALVDGGNPFGASATVSPGGVAGGGASGLSGYSILKADSLDAASRIAGGCPILQHGGSVEVYEVFEIM